VIRADQLRESGVERRVLTALAATASASVRVAIAGVVMELRTDSRALADAFARRYRAHVTLEPVDFCYYVVRGRSRYIFWCGHAPVWEWSNGILPTDSLLFLTDAVASSAIVRYDPFLVSIHAAAFREDDVSAALVGNASAGKTTTLLACARAGFRVYSDERVLTRSGVVYPFLRTCAVRSDGARRLIDDCPGDALGTWLNERIASRDELSFYEVFGTQVAAPPAALRAVFIISGYAAVASAEPLEAASALPALTRWLDARGDAIDRMARGLRLVRDARCYRLVLGTPVATAQVIREALAQVRAH